MYGVFPRMQYVNLMTYFYIGTAGEGKFENDLRSPAVEIRE